MGTAAALPSTVGAAPSVRDNAPSSKTAGTGMVRHRSNGQTTTIARPMTFFSGIVPPPGAPRCTRESADSARLSPITHSLPSGTRTSNRRSDGGLPG
jgi:hypothetical protein